MADKIKNGKMENDINDETLCAEYAAVSLLNRRRRTSRRRHSCVTSTPKRVFPAAAAFTFLPQTNELNRQAEGQNLPKVHKLRTGALDNPRRVWYNNLTSL